MTDTHCHLDLQVYDSDRQDTLDRAWQAGLQRLLVPGLDLNSSSQAISLANVDDRIFAAVGVHPNYADSWDDNTQSRLQVLAENPHVCAIGEIGLDYYRDHTTPAVQRKVLKEQLSIAANVDKPIILHCRNAFQDLFEILTDWCMNFPSSVIRLRKHPGVMHSFGGDPQQAFTAVQAGFYLGINGSLTFKNAVEIRDIAKSSGILQLLLETDAPFITPVPYRGKRNEPAYIMFINEALSKLVDLSPDECGKLTYNNACDLFNW